jgi:hypothetical protein
MIAPSVDLGREKIVIAAEKARHQREEISPLMNADKADL